MLRDASFNGLDLSRCKASKGTFVLWTTKSWTDGTLELGDGSTDGRSSLTTFGAHVVGES